MPGSGHNTPLLLKRPPPASCKRLLGGQRSRTRRYDQMRAPVDITGLRCRLTLEVKECLPSIRLLTQLEQERLEVRCQRIGRRQRLDPEPVALQRPVSSAERNI